MYDPGAFQTVAFVLGLEQVNLCMQPSRAESVSYNPPALPELSPADLKSQMLWGLILQCSPQG